MELEAYTTDELLKELKRRRQQLEREVNAAARYDDCLRVRAIRKQLGMTQKEFAVHVGYGVGVIAQIECGARNGGKLLKLLREKTTCPP